ncbi:hypothetical protein GCM10023193_07780 [Planotetraspora kaengkrachanensis]|uniref:Uncharacterized protein n=1 Tax=Planotetraspora kaengkrachanensis TaxID=575193 RepID=A0A8J3M5Y8_9ACTN|nr:hypothetical protein Pka01_09020 [Planotetraspora kaengkrachanensis]
MGFQPVQQRPHRGAHLPLGRQAPGAQDVGAGGRLGQVAKLDALTDGQVQGVRERGEDLRRRVPIAPLLQPCQVVHADAGDGGQFGSPQARRAATLSGGQSHPARGDGLSATAQECPQIGAHSQSVRLKP